MTIWLATSDAELEKTRVVLAVLSVDLVTIATHIGGIGGRILNLFSTFIMAPSRDPLFVCV